MPTKTIAWIEDDIDLIDAVVAPLEAAGYEIVRLRSAQAARERIETLRQADLILLDLLLPEGPTPPEKPEALEAIWRRGLRLLATLRTDERVTAPAIIFSVRAKDDVEKELHAQRAKFNVIDIVHKPILPSELQTIVEQDLRDLQDLQE